MNEVNGSCSVCGTPTQYTGRIPILCESCRKARAQIARGGTAEFLINPNLATKLFAPDEMLIPKPKTLADFR